MGTNINFNKVLGISKGCSIKLPLNLLLLDTYPNAAVAYSLRKLRTAYSGSAIRVRRFVDNTEEDFGFDTNGDLDIAGIESFFGNNLLLQSENFNTTWLKVGSTVSTGIIAAPVGGGTADKLEETAVNSAHTVTQASGTINNSSSYFLSVYLKSAERTIVDLVSGIAGSSQVLRINLSTGGVVSNTFANSPTITSVGSSWWKVELVVPSALTSVTTGFQVRLTNGTIQTYLGTAGFGCYIWGAQISGYTGSVVPYFKTTTVRAADAFVRRWYDQSGNSNNATQDAVLNQAAIFTNGFPNLNAITNKTTTTWTSDRYDLSPGINPNTKYLSVGVVNRTSNAGGIAQLGVASSIGGLNGQEPLYWAATTGAIRSDMYSALTHGTNASTGNFIMTSEKNASNLKTAYLNGSALPITATEAPGAGNNMNIWGYPNSNPTTCQYQEYVYWNSEQSANRVAIETNINTYWTIY
jgi:hypothetical protein